MQGRLVALAVMVLALHLLYLHKVAPIKRVVP